MLDQRPSTKQLIFAQISRWNSFHGLALVVMVMKK